MEKSYPIGSLIGEFERKGLRPIYSINVFLSFSQEERNNSSPEDLALKLRPLLEKRFEAYKTEVRKYAEEKVHWLREEISKKKKESLENKAENQS